MEENTLKLKYNELLTRYKNGAQYLAEHSEDEKAKKELQKIEKELSKIIEALPDMTEEEKTEGFDIEAVTDIDANNEQLNTEVNSSNEQITQIIPETNGGGLGKSLLKNNAVVTIPTNNTFDDFGNKWQIAEKLSKSSLLPDEFKGRPENIIIAIGMAEKMKMDPFTICQNLHIIRGKLSWSGAFCKTLIEQSGKYTDLDFVYFGKEDTDERGCYLEATRIRDGKRIQGNKVTIKLAKEEKWYSTNAKWRTMTDQMLGYRAAAFFARLYCGEMLNGIMTSEENMDISYQREQPKDILA